MRSFVPLCIGRRCLSFIILVSFLIAGPGCAHAADHPFDLFSKDRNHAPAKPVMKKPAASATVPAKIKKPNFLQKKFALRGTAFIGEKKYAIIQEVGKNKTFSLRWQQGASTPFPVDPRYQLEEIFPRKVKIRYPLSAPCRQDDPAHNIHCLDGGKYAELTIVKMKNSPADNGKNSSLHKRKNVKTKTSNIIGSFPDTPPKKNKSKNPFLQFKPLSKEEKIQREKKLQNDAGYQKRKKQYQNFKPRRIKEEDIPPGMKLQRTPFGDVLIPE